MTTATEAKVTGRELKVRRVARHTDGSVFLTGTWWEGSDCNGLYGFEWQADDMGGECRIRTGEGKRYTVVCDHAGRVQTCDCPNYRYVRRQHGERCKHLCAVAALLARGYFRPG